jgi:hypothetical protein
MAAAVAASMLEAVPAGSAMQAVALTVGRPVPVPATAAAGLTAVLLVRVVVVTVAVVVVALVLLHRTAMARLGWG